jgi:hypothetical protein
LQPLVAGVHDHGDAVHVAQCTRLGTVVLDVDHATLVELLEAAERQLLLVKGLPKVDGCPVAVRLPDAGCGLRVAVRKGVVTVEALQFWWVIGSSPHDDDDRANVAVWFG